MALRPKYSIGKPGIDDNRTWETLRQVIPFAEAEKIEVASGLPIPEHRLQNAKKDTEKSEE